MIKLLYMKQQVFPSAPKIWQHTMELARAYLTEMKLTFDSEVGAEYLHSFLQDEKTDVVLAYMNDVPAGIMFLERSRSFHSEWFGKITHFYVLPQFRGTNVARSLTKEAAQWMDEYMIARSYTSCVAHIGQTKQYENLMKKFGWQCQGEILERRKG